MNKYEAADKFCEIVNKHPDDFAAVRTQENNSLYYHIYNTKAENIRMVVAVANNTLKSIVLNDKHESGFYYVSEPILNQMLQWAIARIENDKMQQNINKDNSTIEQLYFLGGY